MSHINFNSANGIAIPSGLASRRGGQNIKPLSFDALKSSPAAGADNGVPTPRTSRSHLLAGLRTAPKSATAATFPNTVASPPMTASQTRNRNSITPGMYDGMNMLSGPKTSVPRYGQQQPVYSQAMNYGQPQYTTEEILAPPQLHIDETSQEQMDPNLRAQLIMANAYLSDQQQRLQQQLRNLQTAAQQFQGLNVNGQVQMVQQGFPSIYQQQQQIQQLQQMQQIQQIQQLQQMQAMQSMMGNGNVAQPIYSLYDPVTGQQTLYVEQPQLQQQLLPTPSANQSLSGILNFQQAGSGTPRVQVSPPAENSKSAFRTTSPPRRFDSPVENPAPLPPPSANAFRRGHKKSSSVANPKPGYGIGAEEPKSAGAKSPSFPLTPLSGGGGYGPGQARVGEHPIRQPRNPPPLDELKTKPTAKHEGSKNFATRTRRSAVHNLVRAGLERRKEVHTSDSISPISETAEETVEPAVMDNDSDSGRSGSGSLVDNDEAECSLPSSRTSTGSWGAIGSDRPSSRQKDISSDSVNGSLAGSFASLLKNGMQTGKPESVNSQRKAPMLVLTSAEKRKLGA